MLALVAVLAAAALIAVACYAFGVRTGRTGELSRQRIAHASAEETSQRIIGEAERESERIRAGAIVAGKEEGIRLREAWDVEIRLRREEVEHEERRITERDAALDRKFDILDERERRAGTLATDVERR